MRTTLSRGRLTTDIVLAGVFALVSLPLALLGNFFDLLALAGFAGALAVRRLSPGWSLGIAWLAALVQMGTLRELQLYDVAVLGVLYTTAAHGEPIVKWLGLVSAGVGSVVATLYLGLLKPALGQSEFLFAPDNAVALTLWLGVTFIAAISVLVLSWTAGLLVRAVRDSREIGRREEVALRERELAEYRYVVEQERNRIARDMHDVVAHSLAVVIAQADGARFAARTRPETAVEALGTIAGVARGALGDVRMLLAELRHAETDTPQPVLDDLEELLAQLRGAGLEVELVERGPRVELGTGHQIAVYRIVQEALTNALRHGDADRPVDVVLAWDQAGVVATITNHVRPGAEPVGARGARHGIPGMRERAQLTGGQLTIETDEGWFRVIARIPAQQGSTR
ncbi:sensor histidine kinase [Agromyces mediolanus]|uniref:histidine kinase n=1 Tax=Agromyces mediolanus TaxID=41986 RepID=A0A918FGD0_AGRME|nr:histidine kinase [Agromyces mediolanus]GGR36093.1 two-component sensor histidine kinase [Agromyces mediolanus]GLJ72854.1 two-component sensor histidine kinase [Agromyces mediolanus]